MRAKMKLLHVACFRFLNWLRASHQDMGLAKYAESFTERGLACLVFDYRTFGGSDGMPRHYVEPWRWGCFMHGRVFCLLCLRFGSLSKGQGSDIRYRYGTRECLLDSATIEGYHYLHNHGMTRFPLYFSLPCLAW